MLYYCRIDTQGPPIGESKWLPDPFLLDSLLTSPHKEVRQYRAMYMILYYILEQSIHCTSITPANAKSAVNPGRVAIKDRLLLPVAQPSGLNLVPGQTMVHNPGSGAKENPILAKFANILFHKAQGAIPTYIIIYILII